MLIKALLSISLYQNQTIYIWRYNAKSRK